MARLLVRSPSEYLTLASAVATAAPLTFACWFRSSDNATSQDLISIGNSAGTDYFTVNAGGATAGDPIRAITRQGVTTAIAVSSTGYTANTWHHACAVFSAANARAAYIDGGSKGTETTSATPASLNQTRLGARASVEATTNTALNGRIAQCAIWNVALNDAEIAALARGIAPPYVQPAACIGYWPVWGLHSPEIDLCPVPQAMTLVNTCAPANHAPVTPFSSRFWVPMPFMGEAEGQPYLLRVGGVPGMMPGRVPFGRSW